MTTKTVWTLEEVQAWFAGRLPDEWFAGPLDVKADREEVLVVGPLREPEVGEGASAEAGEVARRARVKGFREDTRHARMRIADEAEMLWGRKISWGARCGSYEELFTTQSIPVMSRLRMTERAVHDTLIDAGVARSRSEALNWCVRLVREHEGEWIDALRDALKDVERPDVVNPLIVEFLTRKPDKDKDKVK